MNHLFNSLRWRLQAWHGLLLLLVVAASLVPTHRMMKDGLMQRMDKDLAKSERTLFRTVMDEVNGGPPEPGQSRRFGNFVDFINYLTDRNTVLKMPETLAELYQGREPGYAYFSMRDANDRIILQSANAPENLELLPVPVNDVVEGNRSVGTRREMQRTTSHGLKILVGRDISTELDDLHARGWVAGGIGLGVWLCSLLGGWWLSGRAIRPIRTISQTATRIADGRLSERIDVTAMDKELGDLSRVLNDTFDRLHLAFERQRQFTADASHELRTPLTILLTETQRVLKRERSNEEYREALTTCAETAQRMRKLVEALLLLARQEGPSQSASHMQTDLRLVLAETSRHLELLARDKGRRIETNLAAAPCQGDSESLGILAANLIGNAIEYGGDVTVACGTHAGGTWFSVRDAGPGIAAEHLPHLFDRFYRVDQARTGGSGHTGLGLAIARAIVENHGGKITVQSQPGQGTCFEVLLPGPILAAVQT